MTNIHLYTDLAWLWPLWGNPAAEYARYCNHVVRLVRQYSQRPTKSLLNVCCGGGKNAFNLKQHFRVLGLDLSPAMLSLATKLNPECEFVEGDMRNFSLARSFDSILMDDGLSYMSTLPDLSLALQTAFHHLEPGGVLVATPDVVKEHFSQNRTVITSASDNTKPEKTDVVFIENMYDPDPTDDHYETTILYLIRIRGILRIETDRFNLGLFSTDTWKRVLSDTGFVVHQENYRDGGDEYTSFACIKPKMKYSPGQSLNNKADAKDARFIVMPLGKSTKVCH